MQVANTGVNIGGVNSYNAAGNNRMSNHLKNGRYIDKSYKNNFDSYEEINYNNYVSEQDNKYEVQLECLGLSSEDIQRILDISDESIDAVIDEIKAQYKAKFEQAGLTQEEIDSIMNGKMKISDFIDNKLSEYKNQLLQYGFSEEDVDSVLNGSKDISELFSKVRDEYVLELTYMGLMQSDIDRVLNGEINLTDLIDEINKSSDTTRAKLLLEATYLHQYALNGVVDINGVSVNISDLGSINNLSELDNKINFLKQELEQAKLKANDISLAEPDILIKIIETLNTVNPDLDDVVSRYTVAWEYVENNEKKYVYDESLLVSGYMYTPRTYMDLYGDNSTLFQQLKNNLVKQEHKNLFGRTTYSSYEFSSNEALEQFVNYLSGKTGEFALANQRVSELLANVQVYEYYKNSISSEIDYYIKNIHPYVNKDDFDVNVNFNENSISYLENLKNSHYVEPVNANDNVMVLIGKSSYETSGFETITINKTETVEFVNCIINGRSDGYIESGSVGGINVVTFKAGEMSYYINSSDDLVEHYALWADLMTDDEKRVFNYVYNTGGVEAAFLYLTGDIQSELDNRYLAYKTQMDQEYANENPFLSSISSIVLGPIEGISAAFHSVKSLITKSQIFRTDVHSSADTYRAQVSSDIAQNSGALLSFLYNTGMSMADTLTLIALTTATGGSNVAVNTALSAVTMGSRSYVSSLNTALDKGMADGAAVAVAFSSAIIETAMETVSVGHLMHLEEKLGDGTKALIQAFADSKGTTSYGNVATKALYIMANSVSQGIAEGEEEMCTEIVNYISDYLINKINNSTELSDFEIAKQKYMQEEGYSEEEAKMKAVFGDLASQAFMAGLGGFISGICFGAGKSVDTVINTNYALNHNMYENVQGIGASQFAKALDINISEALKYEKSNDITTLMKAKSALKTEIISEIGQVSNEFGDILSTSTSLMMSDLKKIVSTLWSDIKIKNNLNYKTSAVASNTALVNKIVNEGLVHITDESTIQKIIDSGYVKATKGGMLTSYDKNKTYFFAGIPNYGETCLNLNSHHDKMVGIRLKVDSSMLQDSNFQYRNLSDFAVSYEGNYNFDMSQFEVVYLGLDVNDNGELYYKEITKSEYDNYTPNIDSITQRLPSVLTKFVNDIKGLLASFSYEYDLLHNNASKVIKLAGYGGVSQNAFAGANQNYSSVTSNGFHITGDTGDILSYLGYLNSNIADSKQKIITDNVQYVIGVINSKYGDDAGIRTLISYVDPRTPYYMDLNSITRTGSARDIIARYSVSDVRTALFNLGYLNSNTKDFKQKIITDNVQYVIEAINSKYSVQYGADVGIKTLISYVDPSSPYYMNLNSITRTGSARDIIARFSVGDVRTALFNLGYLKKNATYNYFCNFLKSLSSEVGCDQGCIEKLCKYVCSGVTYDYRQAMEIVNKARENNLPIPKFHKYGSPNYENLKNELMANGFSSRDASIIMSTVNDAGACTYASVVNEIFNFFNGREEDFKNYFGYDMYYVDADGSSKVNFDKLLLDLYVFANKIENGGCMINYDLSLNSNAFTNRIDPLGRAMLDAEKQVYMFDENGVHVDVINRFLYDKGLEFKNLKTYDFYYRYGNYNYDMFKSAIADAIIQVNNGYNVSLGIYTDEVNHIPICMVSTDPSSYPSDNTNTWGEGGGHEVFVTACDESYFYVSSWGKEYKISYEDLIQSGTFCIYISEIVHL